MIVKILKSLIGLFAILLLSNTHVAIADNKPEDCPPKSENLGFVCTGPGACRVEAPSGEVYICDGIPDDMI